MKWEKAVVIINPVHVIKHKTLQQLIYGNYPDKIQEGKILLMPEDRTYLVGVRDGAVMMLPRENSDAIYHSSFIPELDKLMGVLRKESVIITLEKDDQR